MAHGKKMSRQDKLRMKRNKMQMRKTLERYAEECGPVKVSYLPGFGPNGRNTG